MNTGNRGKFSDRIKRIAYNKSKFKKHAFDKNGTIKRIMLIPLMFLDKKIHEDKSKVIKDTFLSKNTSFKAKNIHIKTDDNMFYTIYKYNNIQNRYDKKRTTLNSRKRIVNSPKISLVVPKKAMQVENSKASIADKKKTVELSSKKVNNDILLNPKVFDYKKETIKKREDSVEKDSKSKKVSLFDESIDTLNGRIVSDISKYLIKHINNLQVIESDLYVLSKFDGNKESLDKCREYIAKLKALQNKLNKIRKDFNILKDNVDFDSILEISDDNLLDELIQFRDKVGNDISLATTRNYKLLEEYKYLYVRIDKVVQETDKLEVEIINRKDELEQTGIKFDDFQKKVYSFDKIESSTKRMLDKQDRILLELSSKVSDVSVTKKVEYVYKDFGSLLFNSLKLLGLYMLTPFKNSLPGIAVATVATKKTVDNLLTTIQAEEKVKYIYHAEDYGKLLSSSIEDLANLDNLMVDSLKDIRKVKTEFLNKFAPYSNQLPKYNTILKKINRLEKELVYNQIKVRTVSEKMITKKKENEKTLVKVKKLNNS